MYSLYAIVTMYLSISSCWNGYRFFLCGLFLFLLLKVYSVTDTVNFNVITNIFCLQGLICLVENENQSAITEILSYFFCELKEQRIGESNCNMHEQATEMPAKYYSCSIWDIGSNDEITQYPSNKIDSKGENVSGFCISNMRHAHLNWRKKLFHLAISVNQNAIVAVCFQFCMILWIFLYRFRSPRSFNPEYAIN